MNWQVHGGGWLVRRVAMMAVAFAVMAAWPAAALAQFGAKVTAEGVVDRTPVPAGGNAKIAVTFHIQPGWHAHSARPYSKDLIATRLVISPVEGLTFGPLQAPVGKDVDAPPDAGVGPKITVYEDENTMIVPVAVADGTPAGPKRVKLTLWTQICSADNKECLPENPTEVSVTIDVAAAGAAVKMQNEDVFAAAEKQAFYPPESLPGLPASAPAQGSATRSAAASGPGVWVKLMDEEAQLKWIRETPFQPAQPDDLSFGWVIVFALVGGMILNIMPCVLPVIPLKVLGLVQQAHGDRKKSLIHALVFAGGIISLFVALAVMLKTLGLFYGQQFQSTWFLVMMAYGVLALALSMIGVWTINPPRAVYAIDTPRSGYFGSFMNGVLATLLATPCSAPYLGPVLTWALVQPTAITVLGLALVGVGMSLPYVLLAAFPAGLSKIPTAGRWSELIKQGLGIVMIAVAVFLMTRVPNVNYWPWVLFGAVLVAGVCWAWGQVPSPTAEPQRVWTVRAVVMMLGIAGGVGLFLAARSSEEAAAAAPQAEDSAFLPEKSDGRTWLPFNVALLQEAKRQGRPVVVDWTANWCLNCKAVERIVLEHDDVRKAFAASNVVMLKADLTAKNPPPELLNNRLQGQSIPVLAVFSPRDLSRPVVLRDLYSRETVIKALGNAR